MMNFNIVCGYIVEYMVLFYLSLPEGSLGKALNKHGLVCTFALVYVIHLS